MNSGNKKLTINCECGQLMEYQPGEEGSMRACPSCNRYNLIPGKGNHENDSPQASCPHCGKLVNRTSGNCPFCGENLSITPIRILVFVTAGLIAVVLLLLVYGGLTKATKSDVFLRAVKEYHESYKWGHWDQVFPLLETKPGATLQDYSDMMKKTYSNAKVAKYEIQSWSWKEKNKEAVVKSVATALFREQNKQIEIDFEENWLFDSGKWKLVSRDEILAVVEKTSKELINSQATEKTREVTCPWCAGEGKIRCSTCGGSGKLLGNNLCHMCYKSQGWTVCSHCRGTGLIFKGN